MALKRILLVEPAGFCAGVKRAVTMLGQALQEFAEPIYCYRQLVHNRQVIDQFTKQGVRFVSSLEEIPEGAIVVFSAHGVAPDITAAADKRKLRIIDATCPFVTIIHNKVKQFVADGRMVFLVGHRNHDEVRGVVGEAPESVIVVENPAEAEVVGIPAKNKVALVTQTTLSVAETEATVKVLLRRFPELETLPQSDICSAVRNRQLGVCKLATQADHILVLGAQNSSNSQRLVEVARSAGATARLISSLEELRKINWHGIDTVGITTGASTPDSFINDVINALKLEAGAEVQVAIVKATSDEGKSKI